MRRKSVADDETADVAADEGPAAGDEEPAAGHESDLSYVGNLSARCEAIGEEYYLSQREIEVMQLFMQGYTMSSIAKELFISENTVKTHTRRLYSKLGINKKQQHVQSGERPYGIMGEFASKHAFL